MDEFHFIRPVALLLITALPLVYWWLRKDTARRGKWTSVVEEHLRQYVLTGRGETGGHSFSWLWYLLAVLLIVALAGPAWQKIPQPVYMNQRPVVIALDLSNSMLAQDVLPNRLELAKIRVQDILQERAEGQTALLVFAGDAFTVTPMSDDAATITALLPSLTPSIMPSQGSKIEPALELAGELLAQSESPHGHVLLLTDGLTDTSDAQRAAMKLVENGHRVSVLGFGTRQGDVIRTGDGQFVRNESGEIVVARLPIDSLRAVAQSGRGIFLDAKSDMRMLERFASGDVSDFESAIGANLSTDLWREQGPLLLLICLPFLAFCFRRGWLLSLALVFVLPVAEVHAGAWQDLWLRSDQQGDRQYAEENYAEAARLYQSPEHKAAALYKQGEYEESAELLASIDTSDGQYNRGNAQAFAGNIEEAINAYQRSLALDPQNEDAKHNLSVLEQMKQDQQQQDQEQEQDQNQEQQDEQDQQSSDSGDQQEQQDGDNSEEQSDEQQEQQQDAQSEDEASEEEKQAQEQQAQSEEQMTEEEKQQAVEQWLRRIPDDPGGLLRRKFKRQHQTRKLPSIGEEQEW